MYIHAGDTVHIVVSVSAGLLGVFGTDLQARLQSANVEVVNIIDNGVPVSSGWSYGGLIVDVVPQIDFADIRDLAGLVEGAAGAAGFYVQYGKAVPQLVATTSDIDATRDYRQLQNSPAANNPPPGHVPGLMELLGLDKVFGDLNSNSSLLLVGVVIVVGFVLLSGRR